jgi:hypothetical protein
MILTSAIGGLAAGVAAVTGVGARGDKLVVADYAPAPFVPAMSAQVSRVAALAPAHAAVEQVGFTALDAGHGGAYKRGTATLLQVSRG